MKEFDRNVKRKISEEDLEVPSYVSKMIEDTLENLPEKEHKLQIYGYQKNWGVIAASITVFLLVFMPNISVTYAQTIAEVPIIGDIVKVFTIRKDIYEDEHHELVANIPKIEDDNNLEGVVLINQEVDELASAIIQKFYDEIELSKDGYGSIYIDYEVLTNDASWFTLKLNVNEVAGSSDSYAKFYHIDRTRGDYVQLKDILSEDGIKKVEEYLQMVIKTQMEQDESLVYDIDEGVELLNGESNFYFNENKELVIVYNKYDIAPGYMGCPEFVIPKDIYMAYMYLK